MKTLKFISVLLAVASIHLSSCTLLSSSPLPLSSGFHSSFTKSVPSKLDVFVPLETVNAYKENSDAINGDEVYSVIFQIPAGGGSYEFECANGQFYISKILDSSMQLTDFPPTTSSFKYVHASAYSGPYYRITCNQSQLKYTWKIEVDRFPKVEPGQPIGLRKHVRADMPKVRPSQPSVRTIYVLMWDETDDYNYVFQFEQRNDEYIR